MTGSLTPHPIADIICAWANGYRVEFRYRHHNPGIPEEIYLSDERWHLCGKCYSAWSGINEHRIHADDLVAWEAFKRTATPEDAKDATRWRTFIGLDYAIRAEWTVNLSLAPVLTQWVDSAAAEEDHDAWQCDRCNGDGWHWVEREGVEWRDKVSTKEHCEQCDGLGWLGPDAAKAAAAKKAKPPVQAPWETPMADPCTNKLRDLMARQHARGQIADLVKEFGASFVMYEVGLIEGRETAKANEEWRKHRAERDAYVSKLNEANPTLSQGTTP